jgi:hypothetical protein
MAIKSNKPRYPALEITAMMNPARAAMIFSSIHFSSILFQAFGEGLL